MFRCRRGQGGAAGEGDVRSEHGAEADRSVLVLRHAYSADHTARADHAECLVIGRPVSYALKYCVSAVAAGEFPHPLHAGLAAHAGQKDHFVRITPDSVTGRRFKVAPP